MSQAQLAERIVREGIRNAGSFSSRTVAEEAAAEAIEANEAVISSWLRSPRGKLELDYVAQSPVGQVLREGVAEAVETCRFRLVLLKANSELGWYILTGFPTL